ncbi:hypothetical protein KTF21_03930 [Burkholderia multivorans]|uniref:hypothetical protein n=1 Tax=Burkholderia multivorans TaxID=87883 RepID=UPI001C23DF76|nr:hypothetical protein [Burkholderia multivorans]MBU9647836.1 hypothetical protein [Burkholderia multivorans]MDN7756783.1 hypothetical protein [Burkholderia multivorans]
MSKAKNPLHAIRIRYSEYAPLQPEDFGNRSVVRALFEPVDRRKHAMLRAAGYSAAESFMAVFGPRFIATPEALALAADAYETTNTFSNELGEALATVDPALRDVLLTQNVEQFAALAKAAAADVDPLLKDYRPLSTSHPRESDFKALDEVIAMRQKEIDEAERKEARAAAAFRAELEKGYIA